MLKEGLYDDDEIQLMQEGSIKKFRFKKSLCLLTYSKSFGLSSFQEICFELSQEIAFDIDILLNQMKLFILP